jgi:hypothetical protein
MQNEQVNDYSDTEVSVNAKFYTRSLEITDGTCTSRVTRRITTRTKTDNEEEEEVYPDNNDRYQLKGSYNITSRHINDRHDQSQYLIPHHIGKVAFLREDHFVSTQIQYHQRDETIPTAINFIQRRNKVIKILHSIPRSIRSTKYLPSDGCLLHPNPDYVRDNYWDRTLYHTSFQTEDRYIETLSSIFQCLLKVQQDTYESFYYTAEITVNLSSPEIEPIPKWHGNNVLIPGITYDLSENDPELLARSTRIPLVSVPARKHYKVVDDINTSDQETVSDYYYTSDEDEWDSSGEDRPSYKRKHQEAESYAVEHSKIQFKRYIKQPGNRWNTPGLTF